MTSIPRLSSDDAPEGMVELLGEAGCLVVTDMLDAGARERVLSELAPFVESAKVNTGGDTGAFYPGNTRRVTALISRSEGVREMVQRPALLRLCNHFLGPNCERVQVHATANLVIEPGARKQDLHREDDSFPFFPLPRPHLVLASMWALTDFTKENGGTLLVPGSHRWESGRKAEPSEVVSAEMPAGSMLAWLGGLLHGAGENRSNDRRSGVFLSYSLGWLRQEENLYLDVPPRVANELSPELRALVGYKMHAALGFYDPTL